MKKTTPIDGILGLCAGDAVGIPVKYYSRNRLVSDPVTNMFGYGTYNLPPGTWSEDSSLCFCLAESLCEGLNFTDIANRYCRWLYEAHWTPGGKVFDVNQVTHEAIGRLKKGTTPLEAGSTHEDRSNNGAIISILPLAYYLDAHTTPPQERFELIHNVTGILHRSKMTRIASSIYVQFALNLINGEGLSRAYENMCAVISNHYRDAAYQDTLSGFSRILGQNLKSMRVADINLSNTIVDALEAGFWSLLTTHSYRETILAAVNLGGETDTIGAIAGGLAGIYYGYESIPGNWLDQLSRYDDISELASELQARLYQ